jgi:hypothetical protein
VRLLELPTVTLCAATSTNVDATLEAIAASSSQILFGDVLLLTDSPKVESIPGGRVERIEPLRSGRDYSQFLLNRLPDHVRTEHCLVVQWDGFVLDPLQWQERFLEYDYIGAPWPQFCGGHTVGNGGFSLRSRKLLEACRSPGFAQSHPEDLAIGRVNRALLERDHRILFADSQTAARFSVERSVPGGPTFGFHGVFNMIPLLGVERFWRIYKGLDDRTSVFHDYALLMRQLASEGGTAKRRLQLTVDLVRSWGGRRPTISRTP